MDRYNNRYPYGQPNRHSNSYDTRTYYQGEGHGHRDSMPSGRGSYEQGDVETRWDQYNSANYGQRNTNWNQSRESYRAGTNPDSLYGKDDYRYRSGNREWHLNHSPNEGRQERFDDRYNTANRYANRNSRHENKGRDVFEWVGAGITRAWDGITGRHSEHHDRDADYHRAYRDERRDYAPNQNVRAYGDKPLRGYERGHDFADDTPYRQQQIGDRNSPSGYNQESDFHRAGRNFDRERNF